MRFKKYSCVKESVSYTHLHRLFFAAKSGADPLNRIGEHVDRFHHLKGDAGDRCIQNGAPYFAVFDFIAARDAEHELTGRIGLAVIRRDEPVPIIDGCQHLFQSVFSGKDHRVSHTDQRLVGEMCIRDSVAAVD